MSMSRPARTLAIALCGGMGLSSLLVTPAAAARAAGKPRISHLATDVRPAAANELTASFTLAQTAAQRASIAHLAGQQGAHVAALLKARPAAGHRAAVVAWAKAHGFRVVHSSRFVVTVVGQSDALGAALGTTVKTVASAGRTYTKSVREPVVPAELASDVQSLVGLDNRPAFRHHTVAWGPADVRAMAHLPLQTAAAGTGVTVGTINLSGWDENDLVDYAADPYGPTGTGDPGDAIPISDGQITAVPVNGFTGDVDTSGSGGSGEVALDAEAILAAAPAAKQRLYFADNSSAGEVAALDQMASDAADGSIGLQVASTSWGLCEPFQSPSELSSEHTAIANLVAAGVTMFAATGDAGAYDCSDSDFPDNELAVDFPASDPMVVAVGGTHTVSSGSGYSHTAWGPATADTTPDASYQGDGSGGGISQVFSRPSWQSGTGNRELPDIAGLADPSTGFIGVITGDGGSEYAVVLGGTSLAAPLNAAGLATVLGQTSTPGTGVGNILPTLYGHPEVVHDVNGNSNGYYTATSGYDLVTGLGIVDWAAFGNTLQIPDPTISVPTYTRSLTVPITVHAAPANFASWSLVDLNGGPTPGCDGQVAGSKPTSVTLASTTQGSHGIAIVALDVKGVCHPSDIRGVFLDSSAPTVTSLKAAYTGTTTPVFATSWSFSDGSATSGPASYAVTLVDNNTHTSGTVTQIARSRSYSVVAGHSYTLSVTARDAAGNVGPVSKLAFLAPTDDKAFAFSGFARANNANDYLGSHAYGYHAGNYARISFHGSKAYVGVIKSATSGFVDIYVDGVKKARVDLYSSSTAYRQLLAILISAVGTHTITLQVVGNHRAGAKGNNVYVDSLFVG